MNSFRYVEKALDYEIKRQIDLLGEVGKSFRKLDSGREPGDYGFHAGKEEAMITVIF